MKLEQNEKPLLFSETIIPDIFFSEHLSELPGDYLKIYLYMIFLFYLDSLVVDNKYLNHSKFLLY